MLITSELTGQKLQSYFWLYANIGEVGLKKNRFKTVTELLRGHRSLGGHEFAIVKPDDIYHPRQRHITFLEQDKPQSFSRQHTDQPITTDDEVKHIVEGIRCVFAQKAGGLPLAGRAIDTRVNRKKAGLHLIFNDESNDNFTELHDDITSKLTRLGLVDFYVGRRSPHVTVASSSVYKKPKRVTDAFAMAVKNDVGRIRTQKITIDKITLGQSFYTEDGKRHAERDIAHIDMVDAAVQWHCENPFELGGIGRLLARSMGYKSPKVLGRELAA